MDVCVVTYRNTAARIEAVLRPQDHLHVRDNTHDNIGFGKAMNELVCKGSDPVVVFVNPDGDPAPGCFDALEEALRDPTVVAAEAGQGHAWAQARTRPGRQLWVSAACLAVRRSAFESVGGFDESLFMYCEDVDLSLRLASLGRLVYARDAEFRHDLGPRSWRAQFYIARNGRIVCRRHRVGGVLPRTTVRSVAVLVARRRFGLASAHMVGIVADAWWQARRLG